MQGQITMAMVAVVAAVGKGRLYLPATSDQLAAASKANPSGFPDTDLPEDALGFRVQNYGIRKHYPGDWPEATLDDARRAAR